MLELSQTCNFRKQYIYFIFYLLLFLILIKPVTSHASDDKRGAESLTKSLHGLNQAYQHAQANAKQEALQQLRDVAIERHDFLLNIINKHPSIVLDVALSGRDRNAMPDEIRDLIEQKVEFEGQLKVFYADYEEGPAEIRHYLVSDDGHSRVSLHFVDLPKGLQTGQKVVAKGIFFEQEQQEDTLGAMALRSDEGIMTLALGGTGTTGTVGEQASLGEQSVAVFMVNFQDNNDEPVTVSAAHDLVFNQTNNFMQESSFGQNWLAGQTMGWYTLPINQTCIDVDIANATKQMAAANQVDLSQFSRIIYMFPNNASCGWSGLGTVGGAQSETWINGKFEVRVVGHELGHNYGLHHAHSLECGATSDGTNCMSQEYGDMFDIMGVNYAAHYNAYHKEQLGWLTTANADIVEVNTSGQYTLNVYENNSGVRAIKIPKGVDSLGNQQWYYLEYRQAIGFDSFLENYNEILNGIIIRTGTDQDIRSSYLYDMTPASSVYFDWDDAALPLNSSYQDDNAGITVSVIGMNTDSATIDIALTGSGTGSGSGSGDTTPPANQAPVAVDDSVVAAMNTAISIPVLNNDYDSDGQTIEVIATTQASNGSVSINADGTVSYKPRRKYIGADSFSYSITDGIDTTTAIVSIEVQKSTSTDGGGTTKGGGGKGGGKKN